MQDATGKTVLRRLGRVARLSGDGCFLATGAALFPGSVLGGAHRRTGYWTGRAPVRAG